MNIIFNNFPYSDPNQTRTSHVWHYDNLQPLTWAILKKYITSKTDLPIDYIRIKNNDRTFAPYFNVRNLELVTVDINKYRGKYSETVPQNMRLEYWFEMNVSMFKK